MRLSQAVLGVAMCGALTISATAAASSANHHHKKHYKHAHKVDVQSLKDAARSQHKLIGTAVSHGALSVDETYEAVLLQEFDYVTPENSGKWGVLQSEPGTWDFSAHDELVDFALTNELDYKGHTLVWHSQAPAFVNESIDAAELKTLMDEHIVTTMERYQGQFHAWDVVNEAIDDSGEYRNSVFFQKFGTEYIADAFHLAHSLDRKANLYYNDYNIAGINAKSDAVYEMVKGLVETGVPIDGVGFQMHLTASGAPGYEELVENFRRFAQLGLKINISELDIRTTNLPWDKATNLAIQRQVYHRVTSACMRFRRCESLTTWGFTDTYSWIDSTFGADDPLPFDEAYQRKPAYYGLLDGFMKIKPDALGTMPNLIDNGQFEADIEGWSTWGGTLEKVTMKGLKHKKHQGKKGHRKQHRKMGISALQISDRTETWHNAIYDVLPVVLPGQTYNLSVNTLIHNAKSDFVALSAVYRCEGEADVYLNIANDTASNKEWVTLSGQLEIPACPLEAASIYVEGPEAGVDLIVDAVEMRPITLIPDATGLGPNIVLNSDFESSADYWFGFGSATVSVSTDFANSGQQSGYVTARDATWQGPATSLFLDASAGEEYQLLAWVRTENSSAQINGTVKATCAEGDQYLLVGSASASNAGWSTISGNFTVPNCELLDLTLYFEGPAAGESFYLDDVYVRQVIQPEDDGNLISNGDFESGVQGWSTWGGTLTSSSTVSHSGSMSAFLSNRTASWQGPVYDLLPLVVAGESYDVSAWGLIAGSSADTLNITVKTACSDGTENYHQVDSITANDSDWSELSGSVVLPSCDLTQVFLYFDGPSVGVDTYLDDVLVIGAAAQPDSNLVQNADFEADLTGWFAWGGNLGLTTDAHTGNQAAILTNRTGTWQGPVYNLLSAVEAGATYDISGWLKIQGAASSSVSITVKTACDDGTEAYNWAGANSVIDTDWTEVTGSITLPTCNLTEVSLYFDGPDVGIDTLLDDVSVTLSM